MTIEIESVDPNAVIMVAVEAQNLVNAEIGGVSFPRSLILSDTDWHFLDVSLDEPPFVNPVVRRLLNEPSLLDR